ncbi:MAG: hypothetical protein QG673_1702 [Pseudomonadota bacterium]|nr:hypothetical protein [Pseudomonadota bacterium]
MIKSIKIIGLSLLILTFVAQLLQNIIYKNISISEPLGYYLAIPGMPIHNGDLVLTCLTNKHYKHVFNELGMKDVSGQCANGMMYLIKRIVAATGDKLEVTASGILINGILYKNSKQFAEGRGIKLYPLALGYSRILKEDEFFMLGNSTNSVDSRYFGVINKTDIYRRAILIYKE